MSGQDVLRLTILGCGSSPGTPRINGDWGACDPSNPKNRRSRAAALVERISSSGKTSVVIDTGPDFREQMIRANTRRIDAVVYSHAHADHIHGIDDLRGYALAQRRLVDIYADKPTMERLRGAFGYCFETPPGSSYPPILNPVRIAHDIPFTIEGDGGSLTFEPLPQIHGDILSLGFRIGDIAYCPDVSDIPHETVDRLQDLHTLIIDALQYKPHPSHLSLEQALGWIKHLKPRNAVLTHMHIPLDYDTVMRETPENVLPGHDGMVVEVPLLTADSNGFSREKSMSRSIERVRQAASDKGLEIEVRRMGGSTRTAAEAAAQCGCAVGQIVKSLIFKGSDSDKLYLFLVAGDRRLDHEKAVALVAESLVRADPREVRDRTGFAIGGVAPIGHTGPIDAFADELLTGYDVVWAAAGAHDAVFSCEPNALIAAADARPADIGM